MRGREGGRRVGEESQGGMKAGREEGGRKGEGERTERAKQGRRDG